MTTPLLPAVEEKRPFYLWGEVSAVSLIIMELLWISLWYETLVGWQMPWQYTSWILLGIMFASYFIARGINAIKLNPWVRLAAYLPWAVICLLGSTKILVYPHETIGFLDLIIRPIRSFLLDVNSSGDFWHMVIILVLVARATTLARRPVDLWDVLRSFQIGLLMLLFFGVAYALTNTIQSILPVYGFIFFGLVAMITSRISTISVLRGGRLPVLSKSWWISMFAAAFIVTGVGILAGIFFGGSIGVIIGFLLKIVLAVFGLIVLIVMTPILPLIQLFVNWFQNRAADLIPAQAFQMFSQIIAEMQKGVDKGTNKVLEWLAAVSPWVLGVVLLAILLWGLTELGWLPWKRLLPGEKETSGITPRLAFRKLLQARPPTPALMSPARLMAAARIRRVYAQLLNLCTRLGKPRSAALTPLEFLPTLHQLFPDFPQELERITHAYNQIRYGLLPESDEEVQQVLSAWEAIRTEGKRLRAKNRSRK